MDDEALLRANAPVIAYNASELFHPTTVEGYAAACGLWEIGPGGDHRLVIPPGELDIDRLAQAGDAMAGRTLYMRFVAKPFSRWRYWAWRREGHYARMPHASRFANVGISTRVIDAVFRLTLVLRRRLPKGTVSAGETLYRERLAGDPHACYGRVARDAGWTVCQYWLFYPVNDWRSSYHGINDHEADWETVNVYLAPDEAGELRPRWVAASAHDAAGDSLRRRVDDPEIEWRDGHLVLYAGAGSHSHAFRAADELIRVDAPRLKRFVNATRRGLAILTPWSDASGFQEGLGIPFVDYHRGDGITIGPGGDRDWDLRVIGDHTPWVSAYRGRWGRALGDRFGGESGPTGPRFERSGVDRDRWDDPVGWAGLQKVSPDASPAAAAVAERLKEITAEVSALDEEIATRRDRARRAMAEAQAMEIAASTHDLARERYVSARAEEDALLAAGGRRRVLLAERESMNRAAAEGTPPPGPRDHLRQRPVAETIGRQTAVLRVWAALSTSVLLAILIWLLVGNDNAHYWLGVVVGVVTLVGVESAARHRLPQFIASVMALAIVVVLVIAFIMEWRITLAIVLGAVAAYLLFENVRELLNR